MENYRYLKSQTCEKIFCNAKNYSQKEISQCKIIINESTKEEIEEFGYLSELESTLVANFEDISNHSQLKILYDFLNPKSCILLESYFNLLPLNSKYFMYGPDLRDPYNVRTIKTISDLIVALATFQDHEITHKDFIDLDREFYNYSENDLAIFIASTLSSPDGELLFSRLEDMIYNSNAITALNDAIIVGLIKSNHPKSNGLILDLLKAARLSEGLRSSICRAISKGSVETLIYFLKYLREENLERFTSVKKCFLDMVNIEIKPTDPKSVKV